MKKDNPPIRHRRDTRTAIVESALRLFAASGVGDTTVPDIACAAKTAVGTLYCHFPSKEALANFLVCDCSQALCKYLWDGFPTDASFRHQFGFFWRRYISFALERRDAYTFLQHRASDLALDESSQKALATLKETENWVLDRGRATGELAHLPTAALSAIVHGTAKALIHAHFLGNLELDEILVSQTENLCWIAVGKESGG
ncbi:MAG: TetR family transcriptional regulator [Holophagaceae bacterium]|nr:TetR family transcriptional regulator [Holophagaceae bacterium]